MNWQVKFLIENLPKRKLISTIDIITLCNRNKELPQNISSIYFFINVLIGMGILKKIKRSLYHIDYNRIKELKKIDKT